MELSQIVKDAAGGFLVGFGLGISNFGTRIKEEVEAFEIACPGEEEREQKNRLQKNSKREKRLDLISPYCFGTIYSSISSLINDGWGGNASDNMIVAVPSAYIGKFIGRAIRKARVKKDLETAKKIRDNPENAIEYIPISKKEVIENSLSEIERKILEEDMISLDDESIKRINGALFSDNRAYSYALAKWYGKRIDDVRLRAHIQRNLM